MILRRMPEGSVTTNLVPDRRRQRIPSRVKQRSEASDRDSLSPDP
jgi:hypothetical protein